MVLVACDALGSLEIDLMASTLWRPGGILLPQNTVHILANSAVLRYRNTPGCTRMGTSPRRTWILLRIVPALLRLVSGWHDHIAPFYRWRFVSSLVHLVCRRVLVLCPVLAVTILRLACLDQDQYRRLGLSHM